MQVRTYSTSCESSNEEISKYLFSLILSFLISFPLVVVEKYQDMPCLGRFGRHLNLTFFLLELIAAFCLHEWFFVSLFNHRYVLHNKARMKCVLLNYHDYKRLLFYLRPSPIID